MFEKEIVYTFSDYLSIYNSRKEFIDIRKVVLSFGQTKYGTTYMVVELSERISNGGNLEWRKVLENEYFSDKYPELDIEFKIAREGASNWAKDCANKIFHNVCQETIMKEYFPKIYKQMEDLRQN